MADDLPLTRNAVSADRTTAIRKAVRTSTHLGEGPGASRLATLDDAAGLLALLSDPAIHAPIYTVPRPLTLITVTDFIAGHIEARKLGEGLLFVREGEGRRIMGYSDLDIWPQWAAGKLGGALHPSLQGRGAGTAGAAASFAWMFEVLHLDLICETASLQNLATQRLLDGIGFRRMGQIVSTRPDGTTRDSLVWEITRAEWTGRYRPA